MISREHKCIFVHIPKTGGTSIEKIIWPAIASRSEKELWMGFVKPYFNKYQTGGLQHLLAKQIRTEVGEEIFRAFFKFSVIRNPWDKVVSQYLFMRARKDLREFIGMKLDSSLKEYLDLTARREHVQWMPQYRFLLDDNGELLVDRVLRMENFNQEVENLLSELGIACSHIPHEKRSDRLPYSYYYDRESKEMVEHYYSFDIAYFGYRFNAR